MGEGAPTTADAHASRPRGRNLALILATAPVLIAAVRVVMFSGGDQALLATLAQTLDLRAILIPSVLPVGAFVVVLAVWTAIGDPKLGRGLVAGVNRAAPYLWFVVPLVLGFFALVPWTVAVGVLVLALLLGAIRWFGTRRSHKKGKEWRGFVEDGLATLGLLTMVYLALGTPMWLPLERVDFRDGTTSIGYVLSEEGAWVTFLTDEGHRVERIQAVDVVERQVCNDSSSRSLVLVARGDTPQPACETAEETGSPSPRG